MFRTKIIRAEIKGVDVENGTVDAVVSTEKQDREEDIIRAAGWKLADFRKHPVLLSSHNYYSLRAIIGEWTKMEVSGTKLVGTAKYFVGDDYPNNEEAEWGWKLAQEGIAAYSVGFIPDMAKSKPVDGSNWGLEFNGQQLLEVSQVTVPANPQALQRTFGGSQVHPEVAAYISEVLKSGAFDLGDDFDLETIITNGANTTVNNAGTEIDLPELAKLVAFELDDLVTQRIIDGIHASRVPDADPEPVKMPVLVIDPDLVKAGIENGLAKALEATPEE